MMRALYSCALWLAQPLLRRKLRRRAEAEPGYGVAVQERFGYYTQSAEPQQVATPLVWVHAVSLGETRTAALLVAQLRSQLPGMRLLLTHGTATGLAQGSTLLQPGDVQVWQPWDTPGAVGRFLAHFRPRIGLLMETEVWPNLVACSARAGVPLCLVNARMSEKSQHKAQRLSCLSRSAFKGLAAVWAQSADDAARLSALGATVNGVMGNFKFDAQPDMAQLAQGRAWRATSAKPVLMFASSREGEEQMLLDILKKKRPVARADRAQAATKTIAKVDVQWLIVPRHPQRFDAVAALCVSYGLTVSRRSTWTDGPGSTDAADVWLGDSLGEMALYFGMADAALLGGSFAPLGGQNLIEAAACACPVFMGPHTFNFAEAADLAQAAGVAFAADDLAAAVDAAVALAQRPEVLARTRHIAASFSQAHRGAVQRTAVAIQKLMN